MDDKLRNALIGGAMLAGLMYLNRRIARRTVSNPETTRSQRAFVAAVDRGLEGMEPVSPGLSASCEVCRTAHGDISEEEFRELLEHGGADDEGGFSWHRCDSCNTGLGGNRSAAHGFTTINGEDTLVHLDICDDCMLYLANGDLPERWNDVEDAGEEEAEAEAKEVSDGGVESRWPGEHNPKRDRCKRCGERTSAHPYCRSCKFLRRREWKATRAAGHVPCARWPAQTAPRQGCDCWTCVMVAEGKPLDGMLD